jgi:hypothetical protein
MSTSERRPWLRQNWRAYTVVLELATAADADHTGQHLDDLATYHPAITRTHSGRAQLILSPSPQLRLRSVPVDHGHVLEIRTEAEEWAGGRHRRTPQGWAQ